MNSLVIRRAIILNLVIKSSSILRYHKITVFHFIHSFIYNYDPNIVVTCIGNVGLFPNENLVPHTEIQKHMYAELDLHCTTKHLKKSSKYRIRSQYIAFVLNLHKTLTNLAVSTKLDELGRLGSSCLQFRSFEKGASFHQWLT